MAFYSHCDYYGSCDPMIEGNSGIWFNEEDPDDERYRPECCTNVYVDLARGVFDRLDINFQDQYDYDADNDYEEEYDSDKVPEDYYEAEGDDYD
jgi:hypothetical protein